MSRLKTVAMMAIGAVLASAFLLPAIGAHAAKAMAAALKGKVSNNLRVLNYGEWTNWIKTVDGVKQQLNRRVEVIFK